MATKAALHNSADALKPTQKPEQNGRRVAKPAAMASVSRGLVLPRHRCRCRCRVVAVVVTCWDKLQAQGSVCTCSKMPRQPDTLPEEKAPLCLVVWDCWGGWSKASLSSIPDRPVGNIQMIHTKATCLPAQARALLQRGQAGHWPEKVSHITTVRPRGKYLNLLAARVAI